MRTNFLRRTIALAAALVAAITHAATEPPRGDDTYRFTPGKGEEIPITLAAAEDGVRFAWPKPKAARFDTILLGVRVAAKPGTDPSILLSSGGRTVVHHLDGGSHGLRWVNLTSLRTDLKEGAEVRLVPRDLVLEPQSASLRVYDNAFTLSGKGAGRILILAPHPDDAEIAAFGLYYGSNATIVTVTSGNAGDFNYRMDVRLPAEHYLWKGFLRAVDSVTVPWQGGIPPDRTYNLGYFDARLKPMRQNPAEATSEMYADNRDVAPYRKANIGRLLPVGSRTATWNHLVEDLAAIYAKVKPSIIVMPHPVLDYHNDHQYTAVAAVDALARWSGTARFLLYTNHADRNFYPYGPAGSSTSIPPWSSSEVPVQSIYAHPVSEEVQMRKRYALESMHDLRLSPEEQSVCGVVPDGPLRPDYPRVYAVDYLRRGPRPEEIFFVFDRKGVTELVSSFLAHERNGGNVEGSGGSRGAEEGR